ncbi:MAG: ABC transporter ATP-binding protein [Phycisphaerales bacterium]|nr:ABC transporter ATP-binding protein [Phycisphaerales bacterium]
MQAGTSSRRRFRDYREKRRAAGSVALADSGKPDDKRRRSRTFFQLFGAFWGLLPGHRRWVIASLGTLSVASTLALVMPACTKIAVDYIILGKPWPAWVTSHVYLPPSRFTQLWYLAAAMMGVTVVAIIVGMWGRWQMTRTTKRVQVSLRRLVFEHAVRLPLHRVYQIRSGGVASILRQDAGGAAELLFHMIYNPWNAIVRLVGTLVILTVVDWRMLVGGLILIPTVWLTHKTWVARIRPLFFDIRSTRTGIDSHATEAFGGMRVVRGFARETGESGRFVRGSHFMARQEILTWWWSRGIDIAWQLLIPLATTGVLVYGGTQVLRGTMTIGDVMMFSAYLLMLLSPLEVLATSATEMQNTLAGFDRVLDVLEEPREFHGQAGGVAVNRSTARGALRLDDIWFTYPVRESRVAPVSGPVKTAAPHTPESGATPQPVLRGVSLDVAAGETIALVGPSGSGKTTLCNLIARFHDPQRGVIELDGVDLKKIDVASYRRLLGIVEQDVFLFDGSVAANIAYGRRDATPEQVREAARSANAGEFIEKLERGYDTVVGERGVRLSGGQKQRLAIARAILADPRILILDEATSNLDTESERLIQRSLSRLMRGRTCFVIAHRLSTIRHADRIVVLEDGRIIETGTHDELLARAGRYAEFLRIQLEGTLTPEKPRPSATVA